MPRHGMSLPLNYMVIALIALSVAIVVLVSFSGKVDVYDAIFKGETGQRQNDLIRTHCLGEQRRLCDTRDYSSNPRGWAQDAVYDGRTCRDWAQLEKIFGGDGVDDIPKCG